MIPVLETYITRVKSMMDFSRLLPIPVVRFQKEAKHYIEELLLGFFTEVVAPSLVSALDLQGKKTITVKEIKQVLNIVIRGKLAELVNDMIDDKLDKYETFTSDKRTAKNKKADLIFAPPRIRAILDDVLLTLGKEKIRIADSSSVALAVLFEFLTMEILDVSASMGQLEKKKSISVDLIHRAVEKDIELNHVFCTTSKGLSLQMRHNR